MLFKGDKRSGKVDKHGAHKTFKRFLEEEMLSVSLSETEPWLQHFCVCNKMLEKHRAGRRCRVTHKEKIKSSKLMMGTIIRVTVPPTWLFGHHHPGVGVCLPALAHHTFG